MIVYSICVLVQNYFLAVSQVLAGQLRADKLYKFAYINSTNMYRVL